MNLEARSDSGEAGKGKKCDKSKRRLERGSDADMGNKERKKSKKKKKDRARRKHKKGWGGEGGKNRGCDRKI